MPKISTLDITKAASLWYPAMLTQEMGEINESKAAELLGLNILDYRDAKHKAVRAIMYLVNNLPSGLQSLIDIIQNEQK